MNNKTQVFFFSALAFLSPILVAFLSLKPISWQVRKPALILVITLFGSTIVLMTSDGFVFMQLIQDHYMDLSFNQWVYELQQILMFSPVEGTKGDVFFHVSAYFFGSILAKPELYFTFVSFLYAYFFVSAMSEILVWDVNIRKDKLFWAIIIIFVSYRFIDNLQTVRTWTGLWALFYGVVRYHKTHKIKYLFLMLTAPLFHVAYFLMALPAYAVIFIKRLNPKVFILAYALSFLININPGGVISSLQSTDIGENKVASYYREDSEAYYVNETNGSNFYKVYGKGWSLPNAPHFLAWTLILFGLFTKKRMNNLEFAIFATGIAIATMANFLDFIPAVYNRTMINAGIYIIAAAVLLLIRGELWNTRNLFFRKMCLWGCAGVFSPYIFYVMANMLQFTSIFMFALPILGLNEETNMSIRKFLNIFI